MNTRKLLPPNKITLQLRQALPLDAEDLQQRERLEQHLADAKATMGSQYLLHNYNPTVRPARSVN